MTKVKTINSYAGLSRYMATIKPSGYIPRQDIRTPYVSGPTHQVYLDAHGRALIICETGHRRYEVFIVPGVETVYRRDDDATQEFVRRRKESAAA